MSKKDNNIFLKDIDVPEIVQKKADAAFSKIRMEGMDIMKNNETKNIKIKKYVKRGTLFKSQAAAIVCVCILVAGSITAVAAVYHYWSRGMQGAIQATDEQQVELVNQGMATVLEDNPDYHSMAVTVDNITIKPVETIVDGHFAYISFSVQGYTVGEQIEPCFETVNVYTGESKDDENGWVNMYGSFYNGIVAGTDGNPVYDNGEALEYAENGNLIEHYTSEDGTLEYVITVYSSDINKSLLGESLHVEFENLGTVSKTEYENIMNGVWNFDINLSGQDAGEEYLIEKELGDSGAVANSVDLSPISIKVNYAFEASIEEKTGIDENGNAITKNRYTSPPEFQGVRLKDGTLLPYITNGGMRGYTNDSLQEYYSLAAFDRVIDTDQVEALLFEKSSPDEEAELTEENFYIVPLN